MYIDILKYMLTNLYRYIYALQYIWYVVDKSLCAHTYKVHICRVTQEDRASREEVLEEEVSREGRNGRRNRVRKEGKKGGGREK